MKQCSDKGLDQRQKLVENATLAATMNSHMPELRSTTLDRIVIIEGNGTLQKDQYHVYSLAVRSCGCGIEALLYRWL